MKLVDFLLGRDTRNLSNPQYPLTAANLAEFFDGGARTDAGVNVTEVTSLRMPAVWRAVNIIGGISAALPLKTFRRNSRRPAVVQLLQNPHPDLTPFELWELSYWHRLLWGNAYLYKQRNDAGMIRALWPIPPNCMKVGRVKADATTPSGKIYEYTTDNGEKVPLTDDRVFHLPGAGYDGVCGVAPIRAARTSVSMGLAAEEYGARLFGSGSLMSGILQSDQRLDDSQAKALKERWQERIGGLKKSHEIAVLGSGAKFQPVTMPNSDAQFIESRRFQVSEIARWFGIPPHMLFDTEKSTSWGTGIEQQGIGFVQYTLQPWLTRTEQRISKELCPPSVYAEYAVEGLLRGDSQARAAFYKTLWEIGALNRDEIRAFENLEPIPDGLGETFVTPLNFGVLGEEEQDGQAPEPIDLRAWRRSLSPRGAADGGAG